MTTEPSGEPTPGRPGETAADAALTVGIEHLVDALGVGVILYDADGLVVATNPAAAELVGTPADLLTGSDPEAVLRRPIDPDGRPVELSDLPSRRVLREGVEVRDELLGLTQDDGTHRWVLASAWPVRVDGHRLGVAVTIVDRTAEQEVERAERTVSRATQVLVRATDDDTLLRDMCETIVDAGGHALAWIGRAEDDERRSVTVLAAAGATDYVSDDLVSWAQDDPRGRGPTGTCLRQGTIQVAHDLTGDSHLEPWRDRQRAFRFRASVAIPFQLGDASRGALSIYSTESGAFDERSLDLLSGLASDLEYGLRHLRTTEQLAASEERFRLLAENTGDVVVLSRDGVVEWISPSVQAVIGWEPSELIGRGFSTLAHPDERHVLDRARSDSRQGVRSIYRGRVRRADGTWLWMDARSRPVLGPDGRPDGSVITTLWDTTAEVTAEEALTHAASHDALTGLANRSLLLAELHHALASSQRSGLPTAVLLLDLDHFKYVNDSLGHAVGDELLCAAAGRMVDAVRAGDLVARPGGDEFVVVMRGLADPAEAVAVAQRLSDAFRSPIVVGDAELFTTASIGVAVSTGPQQDALDLLREADTAMYRAKEEGRDRYSTFNEDLRESVTTRLRLANELRTALERGELAVWYQPEVDLVDGRVRAVEALLRWHHPSGELYTADRFIETAEETGLILDMGRWVMRRSCAQAARWLASRPEHPLVVRVNLSSIQLAEAGLLEDLDEALATSGLPPERLCLEITETAMLHETSTVRSNMGGIHARGVRLAIDDFGTGYASLTYLRRYPVDVVKLDRSFVVSLGIRPQDEHIIAGIIDLARRLGIAVTAEGVEQREQAELLRRLGCGGVQGYLYSKAVPADEIEALLDADAPLG